MPTKTTTFEATGQVNGELWSNPANWNNGVPADGDAVILSALGFSNEGDDNIASLTLSGLTVPEAVGVRVEGSQLAVGTLYASNIGSSLVLADAADAGAAVTVSIGNIATNNNELTSDGLGALITDQSPTDLGEFFSVDQGGEILLNAAPASLSAFDYEQDGGTFAFKTLGATTASALQEIGSNAVLEVPGSSVSSVTIDPASLRVVTDKGAYTFTDVDYRGLVKGYTASVDQATGLVALAFNQIDRFQQVVASGGRYLWSNAANWTSGVPGNGDSVSVSATGYDDLASLTLASLTLDAATNAAVHVTGGSLTVASVTTTGSGGVALLDADAADAGAPVTVTVQQADAPNAMLTATGAYAYLLDKTPDASAEATSYAVAEGGLVELTATPLATDSFIFTSGGAFAFKKPSAANLGLIRGVGLGSVIEVPGGAVLAATFGASSLSITTDLGAYAFDAVIYAAPVISYSASLDFATLLEAVKVRVTDTFSPNVNEGSSSAEEDSFAWSNSANWSEGVPVNGDAISLAGFPSSSALYTATDDVPSLNLNGLDLRNSRIVDVVANSLTVGTVSAGGNIAADATTAGKPVVVTIDAIVNPSPKPSGYQLTLIADGVGGVLIDRATTDPGASTSRGTFYDTERGGTIEITATAPADNSYLYFDEGGTIALFDPAPTTNAGMNLLLHVKLELPGTMVSSVSFGATSLSVTTDTGTYAFTNVSYDDAVTGYVASQDATTGLVALTFTGVDRFLQQVKVTSLPYVNAYLWSNPANWSDGVPIDGDSVVLPAPPQLGLVTDDLPALHLSSLTIQPGGFLSVAVSGETLTADHVVAGNKSGITAQWQSGAPVVVTLGSLSGSDGNYSAHGLHAQLIIQGGSDPGNIYNTVNGGFLELGMPLNPASTIDMEIGTLALANPGPVTSTLIEGFDIDDVLELPGTLVKSVVFATNTLTVTTDAGTYALTNITSYPGYELTGYTAAPDPNTGLVAISFTGPDVFQENVKATAGVLAGSYLWSNTANWTKGIPGDGASVDVEPAVSGTVYDDLASPLTLDRLNLNGDGQVSVLNANLTVGTVAAVAGSALLAQPLAGQSVTVTVATITGVGGTFGTFGADGGTFIDNQATDPGETYQASNGGLVQLAAAQSNASTLAYAGAGSTFALSNPAANDAAAITGLAPGDILELPGAAVRSATFGAGSLTVTTDTGSYAFTNVTYATQVGGYTAVPDAATGLVALTFTGPDVFEQNVKAASGPFAGDYLWSNAANWSTGSVPVDGATVTVAKAATRGYDDLPSLSLGSLSLYGSDLLVVGASLTITTLTGGGHVEPGGTSYYGTLTADATDAGAPVSVTIGSIADTSIYHDAFLASGTGALFVDQSATDLGENYRALQGGLFELAATPNAASDLTYNANIVDNATEGPSTIAIESPAATTITALANIEAGDVLELPGGAVNALTFGADSLTVTTDTGTYAFTDVSDALPDGITGYTAARDATTGLVAITFTGPDVFEQNAKASTGKFAGDYLWSNAANWSDGVPRDGDSVAIADQAATGYDDLPSLNLASLDLNGSTLDIVGGSLTASTVTGHTHVSGGILYSSKLVADTTDAGAPVTVTIGAIADPKPTVAFGEYGATGAEARLVDQSATNYGAFGAANGGLTELSAGPSDPSNVFYDVTLNGVDETGPATIALQSPGATNAAAFYFDPGDVLELPGSAVTSATFGATSLSVTTDTGTYAFTDAIYATPVTGYTAAQDAATGLVAITFTASDTFSDKVQATSGPLAGDYLWSNAANWSQGVPTDGDSVTDAGDAAYDDDDDISTLRLTSLNLNGDVVTVYGSTLAVGTVAGTSGSTLFALSRSDGSAETSTVTIDAITGSGAIYGAHGVGTTLIDRSPTDTGNTYAGSFGGLVELAAAPADTSSLTTFLEGKIALQQPAASTAANLKSVSPGDVLELPGTSVASASFGPTSFSVTTDTGTYAFTHVEYDNPVTGYSAAPDPTTGLEAITFTGVDTFFDNLMATSGPHTGDYLWSSASNWSEGVPIGGDAVAFDTGAISTDDLAAPSLSALTIDGNAALTVATGQLSVTGALAVGDSGAGSLTIETGAKVTAALVAVGGQGHITMAGGELDPPVPITIAAGGTITGSGTIDGAVTVNGTLAASGGVLAVTGPVTGTGTLSIGAGTTLDLEQGAALTQGGAIDLTAPDSTLLVGAGQGVSGSILGLADGGHIDFADQSVTASYAQGILTLMSGGATVGTLQVADATASEGFSAKPDGQGGTEIVATPSGTASGDVHLVTFDGLHYDFQADGDFTLVRATQPGNAFDVQIRTTPWALNDYASLTTQVAAQLGADTIGFTLDGTVTIDGAADTELDATHPKQLLAGGTLTATGSDGYKIDWAGGEALSVSNEGFYLNLRATVAPSDGPGSMQGLLGTLSGQANDLALPDGTVLQQPVPDPTLLGAFANAWRVSPDASLLDGTANLRSDTLGLSSSPSFLLADAPGELLTGSQGSAADTGVVIGGHLANLVGATIVDFATRDVIDVTDLASASAAFQKTSLANEDQLMITDGLHSATMTLLGQGASAATVHYTSDQHGGTLLRFG